MGDPYILAFYPKCGGQLDLMAGIKAWFAHGGTFNSGDMPVPGLAWRIRDVDLFDDTGGQISHQGEHLWFDKADLSTLAAFVEGYNAQVQLAAPFYQPDIQVIYYLHAAIDPMIEWIYHYPHRWGLGGGGLRAAYNGLFAFARAAGAAYLITGVASGGYSYLHNLFVQMDTHYEFDLPDHLVATGHRMLALDVNPEMGAVLPVGTPTLTTEAMPHGYTRHWLKGHSSPEFSDDWPRLKRPGPKPL